MREMQARTRMLTVRTVSTFLHKRSFGGPVRVRRGVRPTLGKRQFRSLYSFNQTDTLRALAAERSVRYGRGIELYRRSDVISRVNFLKPSNRSEPPGHCESVLMDIPLVEPHV
ncbi:hypothetical protein EVAR_6193_1 [Eumeta japonica]|uniref:Uncharacterized protein n=1 Tax=Eumeta variegata TaxID=151549 RepID=A0A4C2A6J9_EUMVA|nr:hypothetical protein EVAR_6193_1 [Eumeta japonica]